MKAIDFPQVNETLRAPAGMEEKVFDLPVCQTKNTEGQELTVVAWVPNKADLARMNAGKPIWLMHWGWNMTKERLIALFEENKVPVGISGYSLFPHSLQTENPFEAQPEIEDAEFEHAPMPNPSALEQASDLFNAIWNCIKTWGVNVPAFYDGYMRANGSHVKLLMDAVSMSIRESEAKIRLLENENLKLNKQMVLRGAKIRELTDRIERLSGPSMQAFAELKDGELIPVDISEHHGPGRIISFDQNTKAPVTWIGCIGCPCIEVCKGIGDCERGFSVNQRLFDADWASKKAASESPEFVACDGCTSNETCIEMNGCFNGYSLECRIEKRNQKKQNNEK